MDDFSNHLDDDEMERLAVLIEECAEVQQIACKILRHGYESWHPKDYEETPNRELLENELADVYATMKAMTTAGDFSMRAVTQDWTAVWARKKPYLHHQSTVTDHQELK